MEKATQDVRRINASTEEHELENRYEKYKRILEGLTIMSDIFMRNVLKKRECTEYILRVIMDREDFQDGAHLIYVNAKIKDKETALGRLMHDLQCRTADEMFSKVLSERVRELKETPKGVEDMCREMDEIYNEGIEIGETRGEQQAKKETAMTLASMGMSVDKISQAVKESMDQIQQWLAEGAAMSK